MQLHSGGGRRGAVAHGSSLGLGRIFLGPYYGVVRKLLPVARTGMLRRTLMVVIRQFQTELSLDELQ